MRQGAILLFILLLAPALAAQANTSTEGGNVTGFNLTGWEPTKYWSGLVGWMDPLGIPDPNRAISHEDAGFFPFYTNYPNGTYYNVSMVVTRLDFKPDLLQVQTPTAEDFNTTGMFSNFSIFSGLNFSYFFDSPLQTFVPMNMMACQIGSHTFPCPYVILNNYTRLAVLKFSNGTWEEPLFVALIENQLGFNGTYFDFQYMVPKSENYSFYVYPEDCNITVWIDNVETTAFPSTGVPYAVEFRVTYEDDTPIDSAVIQVVEENGRNILFPNLYQGKTFAGLGRMRTNSSGGAAYALTPTRYNVPDSFSYIAYVEVISPAYCRENFTIVVYNVLAPFYRTSLVNAAYGSEVKSSVQSMNSLTSTASRWIYARKMRNATATVTTAGVVSPLPALKAGAPNWFNITILNGGVPVTGNITVREDDGQVVFVPIQPGKDLYNNSGTFQSNETFILIPTHYNNNANLTFLVYYNGNNIANLTFTVDDVLEPPAPSEMDMDEATNALIASALQNINQVLSNIGKSISTV